MKSLRIAAFTLLLAATVLAGTAQAGQREGAFSLSPMAGYHVFEGDQNTKNAFSGGFSLGYNVTKHWATEIDLRLTPTETDQSGASDQDIDVWAFGMNALYHFNPDDNFVAYITAGFGGMAFQIDNSHNDEDYMMNWGLGAKYFVNKDTALRMELRHVVDLHSDRSWDRDSSTSDKTDNNLMAMAGLYWQFGGVTAPLPQPRASDSDGDGIADSRDKCPGTPLGVLVDAVGCPPVERTSSPSPSPSPPPAAQVVDGDDDGDGVPNSRDKCPGTRQGVIVDQDGCDLQFNLKIEFDFDKAEVRPQYHDQLRQAAAFINDNPGAKFLIAGHTDNLGSDAYNTRLSKERAAAVKKYLAEQFGIGAHLLHPRGYGESRPVASNDTDEGRQLNRRVEIICCVMIPVE